MKGKKHKVGFLISSIWPNFIGWHYHRGQLRHLPAGGWEGRALFETNSWGDEPRMWRDMYGQTNQVIWKHTRHINQSLNLRYCPPFCFYHTGLYNLLGCRHICGKPIKGVLQQTSAAFPKDQGLPGGIPETKGLKSMQQRHCSEKKKFFLITHRPQCKCLQLPKWWFWFTAQAFCKKLKGSNSKPR